jgi:type I restriction enzyme S subunit
MESARDDWKDCLLGDVVTLKRGYDLPMSKRQEGPFPVITSSGFTGFHSEAKVKGPGVVTGRYGTLGEVHYVEEDFWPHNTALYVRDFKGNHPKFVSYFLSALNFNTQNAAAAVPGVNRNFLHMIPVRVPPLPVQRRIAGILSAYDELIENSQRRIRILEAIARSLYREWFVHFRFPDHETLPRVASPLGDIPKGWEVKPLGDVADIKWGDTATTKASYVENGYDAYSASGLDGKLDHHDFDRIGVVLSAIGAQCGKTWLARGKWSCIKNTIRFWSKNESASTEYLFIATEGQDFWPRRGAAQPFISQGDAERKELLIPDGATMKQFTAFAGDALEQIKVLQAQIQNLRRTRYLLLPRLLSGQVAL